MGTLFGLAQNKPVDSPGLGWVPRSPVWCDSVRPHRGISTSSGQELCYAPGYQQHQLLIPALGAWTMLAAGKTIKLSLWDNAFEAMESMTLGKCRNKQSWEAWPPRYRYVACAPDPTWHCDKHSNAKGDDNPVSLNAKTKSAQKIGRAHV